MRVPRVLRILSVAAKSLSPGQTRHESRLLNGELLRVLYYTLLTFGLAETYNLGKFITHHPFRNPGRIPRTLDFTGGLRGRLTTVGPVAPAAADTCILEENGAPRLNAESELLFPPAVLVDTEPTVRFGLRGDSALFG